MRGSLKKAEDKKDTWYIRLDIGRDRGRRVQKHFTFHGKKSDAEAHLRELLELYGGKRVVTKSTVGSYLAQWIEDYKPKLGPSSYARYEGIVRNHLIPSLGHIKLKELTGDQIQAYYSSLHGKQSGSSIRYHHIVLHKALSKAIRQKKVLPYIFDEVILPPKSQKVIMQVWEEPEMMQYLRFIEGNRHYAALHTALHTGVRRSELLALRWQDVDLIRKSLSINRALYIEKRVIYFKENKSRFSRRTIALTASNAEVLRKHKEAMKARALLTGRPFRESDLVFCHEDGSPLRLNSLTRTWETLARQAGVKIIRLHDARHTHATLLLKAGVNPKIVQERLGHSSIQITLDLYSHVIPGMQEAAAENFDRLFEW